MHESYACNTVIDGAITEEKDKGKELALAVFSGTCNRCGRCAHKEAECYAKKHMNRQTLTPKNNNNGGAGSNTNQNSKNNVKKKRFYGNCNYCRKFRHKEADCRKKAADAKNNNQETAATAVSDGHCVEFLLCVKDEVGCMVAGTTTNQIFPDSHKLLKQSSIWIGDTVATMDMMPHDIGMVNNQVAKRKCEHRHGEQASQKSIVIGDILSLICDNQGV